jgi:hypothetical protein
MADISPGIGFVAMQPCRVFDTRNANGPYGGPRLLGNTTRNFDIDSGPCTGIPVGVDAYSMNFGAILPDGANSFVTIWPTGTAQPVVSSINPVQGVVVANAAIVPAGTNGSISVFPNTGLHLYGDINGYFSDRLGNNQFEVRAGGGVAIFGENTGSGYGVWGISATGYGVVAGGGAGGVWATTSGAGSGVYGQNTATTGDGFGGKFVTGSSGDVASAGVKGVSGNGDPLGDSNPCFSCFTAGVLGVDNAASLGRGVEGVSRGSGVHGVLLDGSGTGAALAHGYLGRFELAAYAGLFFGNVHVNGTLSATSKPFVQPHPHDPSKEIMYVSLEGPQSEVYFRGTAQISDGITRIPIPEHFRFVADPATYSALVTPFGAMATVAVLSQGEAGIVVQASSNVRIQYVVYAERSAIKSPDPIVENIHFRPNPENDLVSHLPDSYRHLLIQNGTLREDGTVNMETARRLGWDKEWKKRERPAPQPASD